MPIFNKLVRDRIPELILQDGKTSHFRTLSAADYQKELLKKLVEEATEALGTNGEQESLISELSDVFEVIDATLEAFQLTREAILAKQQERREKRGGFRVRLFLESVDD